jgi:hypothetical protein
LLSAGSGGSTAQLPPLAAKPSKTIMNYATLELNATGDLLRSLTDGWGKSVDIHLRGLQRP